MEKRLLELAVELDSDLALLFNVLYDELGPEETFDYLENKVREAIKEKVRSIQEPEEELVYGYELEVWNSMSEEEKIQIQDRYEYKLQHPDQADWFID